MFSSRKLPRLTRQQQLASRPVRLVEVRADPASDDGLRLHVPIRQRRWAAWLFKLPGDASKTFELDALGRFVWESCDGKTSVQQIIRRLARQYNIPERQAQVATEKFLQTLAARGLIGAAIPTIK